jgi:hypothetical protein
VKCDLLERAVQPLSLYSIYVVLRHWLSALFLHTFQEIDCDVTDLEPLITTFEPGHRVSIHLILALCPSINLLNVEGIMSGWKSSINLIMSSSLDINQWTHECNVQGPSPLRLALITCQAPACLNNSSNLPFPPLLPSPSGISVTTDLIISLHILTNFSLSRASPDHSFNPGASWTLPAEVRYARL